MTARRSCLIIVLTLVTAVLFKPLVETTVQFYTAREMVCDMELQPTIEHICMMHEAMQPNSGNFPPTHYAYTEDFCPRISYSNLIDNGSISIAVFNAERPRASRCSYSPSQNLSVPVTVNHIASYASFTNAMATADIVLYFGHGNFGRGIRFSDKEGDDSFLRMGPEQLTIPLSYIRDYDTVVETANGHAIVASRHNDLVNMDVQCDIFWYMGCRTFHDYADTWHSTYPDIPFVGSYYSWVATSLCDPIEKSLTRALLQHGSLRELLDNLNDQLTWDILCGRRHEWTDYGDAGPYSPVLLDVK